MMSDQPVGQAALAELQDRRTPWAAHLSRPIQLPQAGLRLELASRRGDDRRTLMHLQQMCVIHREHFALSTQIKHLYLVDGFITLARAQNPHGLASIARSLFELNAFLHEIQSRLADTAANTTENNWVPMGEKFFGIIVRARFATTNPALRALLLDEGLPPKRADPFNVVQCVNGLADERDHSDALTRYSILCDSVHHNLGSLTRAHSGSWVTDFATIGSGGMRFSDGRDMPVTQYEYPVDQQAGRSIDEFGPGVLRDALACVQWLNRTPASPYSPELLLAITGSELGMDAPSRRRDGP